ncbi:uncharacterized protein LOC132066340 [Lycium ferocissimum]|uniref:uncharacterized protein LOC132066340 n=1 Tax=Lycium ferocissimum TaxID=112874 RepID=UPI0028163D2A|nr:uncharacterized protein LOC132066340 [Lycium ferocissimum]
MAQNYDDQLADVEHVTLQQLEKWSLIEEKILQQKSRATWIKLGDGNNKYFSVVIKDRKQRKQINVLTSLAGPTLHEPAAIQHEIISFYKSLMAWHVINKEVNEAVLEFFSTGKLLKAVNCTAITLLPKITKSDFAIISHAQSGFIPGRKIADSVILAHELVKSYSRKHITPRCMIKVDLQKAYDSVEWPYLQQVMEDDLLLFAKADLRSITKLQDKFIRFSRASGLQPNLAKSSVYIGGLDSAESQRISHYLGYGLGELPFKYLGVPLTTKKLSILQWQPLIEKVVTRISSWTAKKLSYAGRIQLVKSVIFGVQSYWAHLFVLPAKVIKAINAYCRSFIWSGLTQSPKKP